VDAAVRAAISLITLLTRMVNAKSVMNLALNARKDLTDAQNALKAMYLTRKHTNVSKSKVKLVKRVNTIKIKIVIIAQMVVKLAVHPIIALNVNLDTIFLQIKPIRSVCI
jgi:hypothetical protein